MFSNQDSEVVATFSNHDNEDNGAVAMFSNHSLG